MRIIHFTRDDKLVFVEDACDTRLGVSWTAALQSTYRCVSMLRPHKTICLFGPSTGNNPTHSPVVKRPYCHVAGAIGHDGLEGFALVLRGALLVVRTCREKIHCDIDVLLGQHG